MKENRRYYSSAFVLYLNFFIHGIGSSILGQQVIKEYLSGRWGSDVAKVTLVAAALGLGRLVTLPIAGPVSDKAGRKVSVLIGIGFYILFFLGIAISPNMGVAYAAAICGGAANSFIDTGAIPACVEILKPKSGLATMFTKLFISIAQLILPFLLILSAGTRISYAVLLYGCVIAFIIIGIFVTRIKLPGSEEPSGEKKGFLAGLKGAKFTPGSIALILIGFTSTATFQLWLNCAQTFGVEVAGMKNPAIMQTYYAAGTITAIFVTSILVNRFKPVRFLLVYPSVAVIMLLLVYLIGTPFICSVGAFVIGYSAAGGVLQLATAVVNDLFPLIKGTITGIIMIASSLSNYTVLSLAGSLGETRGAGSVMFLNIIITAIGVLLAIFVNMKYKDMENVAQKN